MSTQLSNFKFRASSSHRSLSLSHRSLSEWWVFLGTLMVHLSFFSGSSLLPPAEFVKNNSGLGDEPIDIEDLVNIEKSSGPCPYYMSRELHKVVDILFAPYNYLIDPGNRKSLSIEWANSILIFDEAHNLEGICADAASFDLPSGLLTSCISEAENCVDLAVARRDESNDKSYNPDNFAILRALLLKLEKRIAEVPIDSKELGFTKLGPYIYELLGELNITHKTATMLLDTIEDATVLLEEEGIFRINGENGQEDDVWKQLNRGICRSKLIYWKMALKSHGHLLWDLEIVETVL